MGNGDITKPKTTREFVIVINERTKSMSRRLRALEAFVYSGVLALLVVVARAYFGG